MPSKQSTKDKPLKKNRSDSGDTGGPQVKKQRSSDNKSQPQQKPAPSPKSSSATPSPKPSPAKPAISKTQANLTEDQRLGGNVQCWNLPLFQASTQETELVDFFNKWGVVAVSDAITAAEGDIARNRFWDWIECLGLGIKRGDAGTYENWPGRKGRGIINIPGSGQLAVEERMKSSVQLPYRQLYKNWNLLKQPHEPLVASLDGINVFKPSHCDNEAWPHVDQNKNIVPSPYFCVQGALCLLAATAETGGLVVVPGSPAFFGEVADWKSMSTDKHYSKVNAEHFSHAYLCCVPANTLVLWSSSTVHWNTGPLKAVGTGANITEKRKFLTPKLADLPKGAVVKRGEQKGPNSTILRLTYYISFEPKSRLTKEGIDAKKKAITEGLNTPHWAASKVSFHLNYKNSPPTWADENTTPFDERDERQPKYTLQHKDFRSLMFGTSNIYDIA